MSVIFFVDVVGSSSLGLVVEVFIQFVAIGTEISMENGLFTANAESPPIAID